MKLQKYLSCLIGSTLKEVGRSTNMLWLSFIKDNINYALNVQCFFRFIKNDSIITTRGDMYYPANSYTGDYADFDWDIHGQNLFDERVMQIINKHRLKCMNIVIKEYNDIDFEFDDGMTLSVYSDCSIREEQWRLFEKGNLDKGHIVVTPFGFSIE